MPVDRTTAVDALKEATRTLQATEHEMLADERRAFRIRQLVGLMMAAEAAPPPESRDATSTVGLGPELRLIFERAADQAGLRRPLSERNQNRLARVVAGVFYDSRQSSPPRPEMAAIVRASVLQFQLESAQTARDEAHLASRYSQEPDPRFWQRFQRRRSARERLHEEISALVEIAQRIEEELASANKARRQAEEAFALAAVRERRWKRMTLLVTLVLGIPGAIAALHALAVF